VNEEDIIRMAREAGMIGTGGAANELERLYREAILDALPRFAALVEAASAAAEREAIKWNSIHSCHADCQNPACVIVREAVAAEREACAKVCDHADHLGIAAKHCAIAIRLRGQHE
jgi:hypothetical protein